MTLLCTIGSRKYGFGGLRQFRKRLLKEHRHKEWRMIREVITKESLREYFDFWIEQGKCEPGEVLEWLLSGESS